VKYKVHPRRILVIFFHFLLFHFCLFLRVLRKALRYYYCSNQKRKLAKCE